MLTEKNKVFEKFLFFSQSFAPLVLFLLYHCPVILSGTGGGSRWRWRAGVGEVGHRVSLQWHSSLYICLLSRGISCWPKSNGCPSARHLQYCRKGGGKQGGRKKKNKLLSFAMLHSHYTVWSVFLGAERPAL